jgi:tetratricopeptide (TPR) repeat protein
MKDGLYLLHKNPSPLLRARTLYLLGSIHIDERQILEAKTCLTDAFEEYGAIENKFGGQYLALSMLAWAAILEDKYDEVIPLLDRAQEYNEKLRDIGLEPYSLGMYHETLAELHFVQGDYHAALLKSEESENAYREAGELMEADLILTKVALLKLLDGSPKKADEIAKNLWTRFNNRVDRARSAAYNEITLMKLDQCSGNESDLLARERTVRIWAESAPGGKALIELMEFVLDRDKAPCPEWR